MSTTAAEPLPDHFMGFRRGDGRVGVRNHLLVLSTVALTARLAERASEAVQGAVCINGEYCRGLQGTDAALQGAVLERLVTHPNVGAALVLTFDRAAAAALESRLSDAGRPWRVLAMMDAHGMEDAVARAQAALSDLDTLRTPATRSRCDLAELTLALECGGSDTTSALAANPVIGHLVDRVVSSGGRAIVSETAEFIGAEDIVRARAATPEIGAAITDRIARTERIMTADGESYRGVNPTRENIEAGLTTLVEKSMGAIAKTGRAPFAGCLEFAEPPKGPGLHFMDTPFFTPVSLTGMVAAGAQIVLFALGVFNPGGAPLAPTVRLSGNARTLADWGAEIDIDVSAVIASGKGPAEIAPGAGDTVTRILEGETTAAERCGEGQVIVPTTAPLF